MGRRATTELSDRIGTVLASGEQLLDHGRCWGALLRGRGGLLLGTRREYELALSDRRLLILTRPRGRRPEPAVALAKRYDTFSIERVRRRRPLLQVVLQAANGSRLVLEFRPRSRRLGRELLERLS
jgi:hypothetical protein